VSAGVVMSCIFAAGEAAQQGEEACGASKEDHCAVGATAGGQQQAGSSSSSEERSAAAAGQRCVPCVGHVWLAQLLG
jgi:hypothetical protein